jgi:hypothetical protein
LDLSTKGRRGYTETQAAGTDPMNAQDQIEQLKHQIEQLEKALGNKHLPAPKPPTRVDNDALILEMARYSEGLKGYSEQEIRRRWNFTDADWVALGADDRLVERIQETKAARVRSGAAKREKAQQHVVAAVDVVNGIVTDPKANARHRIDAAKALDQFAGFPPETAANEDRVVVTINLGADQKLVFDKPIRSGPVDDEIIDSTPGPIPGFLIEATKKEDGGGEPL